MLLKAALNGARTAAEHPHLPLSPEQLAAESRACVAAGAGAVHLHVRAVDGRESLAPADVARTVDTVRTICPGTPIGISSGLWITGSAAERLRLAESWSVVPDFVSVNFDESGAAELARLFLEREIGVEAGLADARATQSWIGSGLAERCLRVLLEPQEQVLGAALGNVAAIEAVLDGAAISCPRLLHGVSSTAWPLLREAAVRDYQGRIGLEDTLALPDGTPAPGNASLVRAARQFTASVSATPAAQQTLAGDERRGTLLK